MHVVLLIQARCNSSKIPFKIVKELTTGKTMIEHIIDRCYRTKNVNQIILNTTINHSDNKLINILDDNNQLDYISVYRGSEKNILERTYQAALMARADIVVRVMGNTPFIDSNLIDEVIDFFKKSNYDYVYLSDKYSFPSGFGFDIFSMSALKKLYVEVKEPCHLEHISSYILNNNGSFNCHKFLLHNSAINFNKTDYPNINFDKLTLNINIFQDWEYVKRLFTTVYQKKPTFNMKDVLNYLNKYPNLIVYYEDRIKNDKNHAYQGKGQELAILSKNIIPNGTQDLTKLPESKLPEVYPTYYVKACNIEITTMDGYKLKDFSTMSNGSCILGYRDKDVDAAAHDSIERCNLSSLSNPNEVKLTEILLNIHHWASFARYTKSESNAFSLALKIARGYNKRTNILISGNGCWHDSFLAANIELEKCNYLDKSANNSAFYKFDDLPTDGVPQQLKGMARVIDINQTNDVIDIIQQNHNNITAIFMEPGTTKPILYDTYNAIRDICDKYNILIVMNEIKFGFRYNTGGLHLELNFVPDMAIFGNSMSNGYNLAAVIGKRKLHNVAKQVYATDNTWYDDIGINTAIETINKHKQKKIGKHIMSIGRYFQKQLEVLAKKHNIPVKIKGIPSLTQFEFNYSIMQISTFNNYIEYSDNDHIYNFGNLNNALRTLYIQMMLKYNILADTLFYPSYAHSFESVDFYLRHIDIIFAEIIEIVNNKVLNYHMLSHSASKSYQLVN
jgi:glutamate-1-semialdehyde aminotransferase/spore coat polysaccharide biosynthesis protein SpsF (cytidylyltransferase family)